MSVFDDILAKVPHEVDRATMMKYPDLKAAVDKMEQDLAAAKTQYTQADQKLSEWETWKTQAWDPEKKMTRAEAQAQADLALARQQIAALEALGGSEMSFDEILQGLQAKGFVPKPEIEALVKEVREKAIDEAALGKKLDQLSLGFQAVYARTAVLPQKHFREFQEDLDMDGLFKYMGEKNIMDPQVAYDQIVAPKRDAARQAAEKKRDEDTKAAIEAARKEGEEKAKREIAMGSGGRMPTDSGSPPALGPLQRRQLERGKKTEGEPEVPEGTKLGDLVLAQKGLEALQKERTSAASS